MFRSPSGVRFNSTYGRTAQTIYKSVRAMLVVDLRHCEAAGWCPEQCFGKIAGPNTPFRTIFEFNNVYFIVLRYTHSIPSSLVEREPGVCIGGKRGGIGARSGHSYAELTDVRHIL